MIIKFDFQFSIFSLLSEKLPVYCFNLVVEGTTIFAQIQQVGACTGTDHIISDAPESRDSYLPYYDGGFWSHDPRWSVPCIQPE